MAALVSSQLVRHSFITLIPRHEHWVFSITTRLRLDAFTLANPAFYQ
jgi:hypothetical protein